MSTQENNKLGRAERIIALAITALVVVLQIRFSLHAGGLWRDEANGVALAILPTLSQTWDHLDQDSCPMLWPLVLHCWAGIAHTDAGFRFLGCLVLLSLTAALWLCARWGGFSPPLLPLALLGMNPTMLQWLSLRAYGLGIVLLILTIGLIWKAVEQPSRRNLLAAGAVTLLSVQCLYVNFVLVVALCLAAVIIHLRKGHGKNALPFAAIALLCGLSLLPYLGVVNKVHSWSIIVSMDLTPAWIWERLSEALCAAGAPLVWVWAGLFLLALGAALGTQTCLPMGEVAPRQKTLAAFSGLALALAAGGYYVFLKELRYLTYPWHYASGMALAAISMATLFSALAKNRAWRIAQIGLCIILVALALRPAWEATGLRQTNADLIAAKLGKWPQKDDLILVYPWYCGVSFGRAYHGRAAWTTVPAREPGALFEYAQIKRKMMLSNPIEPELRRAAETLRSGHQVWVVTIPVSGATPHALSPAPDPRAGWFEAEYTSYWVWQSDNFLRRHAGQMDVMPVAAGTPINPYEKLDLEVFRGWRP